MLRLTVPVYRDKLRCFPFAFSVSAYSHNILNKFFFPETFNVTSYRYYDIIRFCFNALEFEFTSSAPGTQPSERNRRDRSPAIDKIILIVRPRVLGRDVLPEDCLCL